jgi:hypothetical protein
MIIVFIFNIVFFVSHSNAECGLGIAGSSKVGNKHIRVKKITQILGEELIIKELSDEFICFGSETDRAMRVSGTFVIEFEIDSNDPGIVTVPGLKNAKEVLGYLNKVYPVKAIKEPSPCGEFSPKSKLIILGLGDDFHYLMRAHGDGLIDSCLGVTNPGGEWSVSRQVIFNAAKNSQGEILITNYNE